MRILALLGSERNPFHSQIRLHLQIVFSPERQEKHLIPVDGTAYRWR